MTTETNLPVLPVLTYDYLKTCIQRSVDQGRCLRPDNDERGPENCSYGIEGITCVFGHTLTPHQLRVAREEESNLYAPEDGADYSFTPAARSLIEKYPEVFANWKDRKDLATRLQGIHDRGVMHTMEYYLNVLAEYFDNNEESEEK